MITNKEKKSLAIFLGIIILIILAITIFMVFHVLSISKIKYPYVQEYIVGTGNIKGKVDVEYFKKYGDAFEIGATKEGFAVFKNPKLAFKTLKKQFKDEIKEIKKEYDLGNLSQLNYDEYVAALRADGSYSPVYHILNIYENSFEEMVSYE